MKHFKGSGVSGGIAIGKSIFFQHENLSVAQYHITDIAAEQERFVVAKAQAICQLQTLYERALHQIGQSEAEIFAAHQMLLEDTSYHAHVVETISAQRVNAEYAVRSACKRFAEQFRALKDTYMQERAADIEEVSKRILMCLSDTTQGQDSHAVTTLSERGHDEQNLTMFLEQIYCKIGDTTPYILCTDTLSPSELLQLASDNLLAIVTASGTPQSHAAILAEGMDIPVVFGVGEAFYKEMESVCDTSMKSTTERVRQTDIQIIMEPVAQDALILGVDGENGEVWIRPDAETVQRLRDKQKILQVADMQTKNLHGHSQTKNLHGHNQTKTETKPGKQSHADTTAISILANIHHLSQLAAVRTSGAEGIGLFRSEFLYMERSDWPTEEVQFAVYKTLLEHMGEKSVVVRTLDIGADKQLPYFPMPQEENPAFGMRGIRFCLAQPDIFKTQLRALYRASVYGNLGILFPMITSVSEVEQTLAICEAVKAELKEEGSAFSDSVVLGIMIETPAAALISDRLAPLVDFFSVGTNDLIQYTLACDRQNPALQSMGNTQYEPILRLIEMTAINAHKHHTRIGICGALAADTTLTEIFLRMGIDALSVPPAMVTKVRAVAEKMSSSKKANVK